MTLAQIEEQISYLPVPEQLVLIERVAQQIRQRSHQAEASPQDGGEVQLVAMAADLEIQRELRAIAGEFSAAEADGLGY